MSQTILITGASSGIGKTTARHFQSKGWNVIATMRNPAKENELTTLDNVHVVRLDVQDAESITTAVKEGIEQFGQIDVLLNNAGYGSYGLLEATPMEKIRRQFDVNVIGLLATTKAVLPHFRENRAGTIINIASMGGKVAFPLGTLYHGSKFAVEGLSEALSFELDAIGVRVKIIEPGSIKTNFGGSSFDFNNDESLTEYQDVIARVTGAFAGIGDSGSEPELVAEVIFEAATDDSDQLRYIAGADAEAIIANRKAADDETFLAVIKQQFDLIH